MNSILEQMIYDKLGWQVLVGILALLACARRQEIQEERFLVHIQELVLQQLWEGKQALLERNGQRHK